MRPEAAAGQTGVRARGPDAAWLGGVLRPAGFHAHGAVVLTWHFPRGFQWDVKELKYF